MLRYPFTMMIPAEPDAIYGLVDTVTQQLEERDWPEQDVTAVQLALIEAVANAIRHGCGGDSTKQVECWVSCSGSDEIVVAVRDPGAGFDSRAVPDPVDGMNRFKSSGRGIFLMRALMDQVVFADGGREVQMRKRRTPDASRAREGEAQCHGR